MAAAGFRSAGVIPSFSFAQTTLSTWIRVKLPTENTEKRAAPGTSRAALFVNWISFVLLLAVLTVDQPPYGSSTNSLTLRSPSSVTPIVPLAPIAWDRPRPPAPVASTAGFKEMLRTVPIVLAVE